MFLFQNVVKIFAREESKYRSARTGQRLQPKLLRGAGEAAAEKVPSDPDEGGLGGGQRMANPGPGSPPLATRSGKMS